MLCLGEVSLTQGKAIRIAELEWGAEFGKKVSKVHRTNRTLERKELFEYISLISHECLTQQWLIHWSKIYLTLERTPKWEWRQQHSVPPQDWGYAFLPTVLEKESLKDLHKVPKLSFMHLRVISSEWALPPSYLRNPETQHSRTSFTNCFSHASY